MQNLTIDERQPGRRLVWILRVVALGISAWALLDPSNHPSNASPFRRFVTPSVSSTLVLSQTFRMEEPSLHAIDLRPAAVGAAGAVRFELFDLDANLQRIPELVRSADVEGTALSGASVYRFTFAPVEDSLDRTFQLTVTAAPGVQSTGVAFWATRGDAYKDGTLLVNDRERWADLLFRTHSPAQSTLLSLAQGRYLPRWAVVIALLMLAISWRAVSALLREAGRPEAGA